MTEPLTPDQVMADEMEEKIQDIEVGSSIEEMFSDLGVPASESYIPICHSFSMVSGPPNSGKTSLALSFPRSFILHLDGTSLPIQHPSQLMRVWPGVDSDGATIDASGQKVKMSLELVRTVVDKLVNRAKAKKPRPEVVVFDTVAALCNLGQDYLVRKAAETTKHKKIEAWRDLHGQSAYDSLYSIILNLVHTLRGVGYGVLFLCHVTMKTVTRKNERGEEYLVDIPKLMMFPGLWAAIQWQLEVSAVMGPYQGKEFVERPTRDGRTRRVETGKIVEGRFLSTRRQEYSGIIKSKYPMEDVIITLDERKKGWKMLEEAYRKAAIGDA